MSEAIPQLVRAVLTFDNGEVIHCVMMSKVFSSGRHGMFGQIPSTAINQKDGSVIVFNGQLQLWDKTTPFVATKKKASK
tara:strand:- start:144 stop:380 length:237 start_codon:yes stop_codon:yes gene_type:complete